ncbi:MAG: site-specific integrase [Mycoplasmataceae bacterium]|nr:site-specific integrase [Mycoplasmataceae bacterium]
MEKKTITLSVKEILKKCLEKKYSFYYYLIKNNVKNCFGKNYKTNISNVNELIKNATCANTGIKIGCGFNWAYDLFYGIRHNHKLINLPPKEFSKNITRLTCAEIDSLHKKFKEWINNVENVIPNNRENLRKSREKIYHVFNALVNSGMRIGELCSINFTKDCQARFLKNQYTDGEIAEIVITTEKTHRKREIYFPKEDYDFFTSNKIKLTPGGIQDAFRVFKEWAKIEFRFTAHSLRRTFATSAYSLGVDIDSICMCLGNTHKVCCEHYILSSLRNYDTFELVNGYHNGNIVKFQNMHFNSGFLKVKK